MKDVTVGELWRGLARYQPFVATLVALVLIVALLPGRDGSSDASNGPASVEVGANAPGAGGLDSAAPSDGAAPDQPGVTGGNAGGGGGTTPGGSPGTAAPSIELTGAPAANCDTATGRLAVPTNLAPPCVTAFSGDNGGSAYQGVTGEEIVVAVYDPQDNPTVNAVLGAAGVDDTKEQVRATTTAYFKMFEALFETYGRSIRIEWVDGSGPTADDAAAKADAVKVAVEIGAFASIGAPASTAYVDELVARGVMCICTNSLPIEFYAERDPYVISPDLPASTQGYAHRAEFVGKLLAGRKAEHAGDPVMQMSDRRFGVIYYDTADQMYSRGVEFFERELARYGVELTERIEYSPGSDQAQEQARTVIARLKDKGVTSILCECDPISPIFFTSEATRQGYQPEWVVAGAGLMDSAFFARTYDQTQWAHAFGITFLPARNPAEQNPAYKLHEWFYGAPPAADDTYLTLFLAPFIFMEGVHMAGPTLTPTTFRDGLFALPATGGAYVGAVTSAGVAYGTDKGVWPFTDYVAFDDATELWWDQTATGPDELGNQGQGLYRYVEGGKRYLPGQWPARDDRAFDPEGTVTIYEEVPENERSPDYPCRTKNGAACPGG